MKMFTVYILKSLIKIVFLILVALCGLYVGYMLNHGMEIYFRKHRKQIKKNGKLFAYMNRHYYAVFRKRKKYVKQRDEKWLYKKCYNYAKQCDDFDIKTAIAYLTSNIKQYELFSVLIAIGIGFNASIVGPYAKAFALLLNGFNTTVVLNQYQNKLFDETNANLQFIFGIIFALVLIFLLIKSGKELKKQQYLLCMLEEACKK